MSLIKIILTLVALLFGVMAAFWLLGIVWSLFGYLIWFGVIAALGYGGYRVFKAFSGKSLGPGTPYEEIEGRDYAMSWEEYDKKYLNK